MRLFKSHWLAAAQLGLVSSTLSTLLSQVTAAMIGRDALVDWMTVAAIPARNGMLTSEPTSLAIAVGIAFHQWADFSWAMVFFGLFGRWTSKLSPLMILGLAMPWALFTSATEWFVLVPLFPFFQPIFTLQQPFWIGFLVHFSSALMYPLFAWLRWPLGRAPSTPPVRFAQRWAIGLAAVLFAASSLALANAHGYPVPYASNKTDMDKLYIRHMYTHHAQGIELARLGVARAQDPALRSLAALMAASQAGENNIFDVWWRGWFAEPMLICSSEEKAAMPGYLTAEQMVQARQASDDTFDATFIQLMTMHHAGAVKMADVEWHSSGDPRLRIMAHAIRHEQQGEIALMHRAAGIDAVRQATQNMLANNLAKPDQAPARAP